MAFPKKENPYQFKSRDIVYEKGTKRFIVDEVEINGHPLEYAFLEKKGGVTIVAMDEQGRVPMVGQWRYPLKAYSWEFPAGGMEEGESILETAQRELKEEAGVQAEEWILMGSMNPNSSNCSMESHVYLARKLTVGTSNPEPDEALELQWIPWDTCVQAALSGEIMEALSLFAVLKVQAYLQSEG